MEMDQISIRVLNRTLFMMAYTQFSIAIGFQTSNFEIPRQVESDSLL